MVGESENYDTEQEHLNRVFRAHLRITSLRALAVPEIEFSEYLSARDGRPIFLDEKDSDISHWQTRLVGPNVEAAAGDLKCDRFSFVPAGVVPVREKELGFGKVLMVSDADSHVVEIVEQ